MDLSRIFIKNACPTSIGGQAVMEGVMMKGTDACAVAVRTPEGKIHIRTEPLPARPRIASIPLLRGVYVFVESLMQGMKTLMYSADVLQAYGYETVGTEEAEPDRLTRFLEAKLGARGAWNVMIGFSVALAILFTVLIFVIGPTALVGVLKKVTGNEILLNLAEGILRIVLFIGYIAVISRMEDIKRLFRYHGAEHETIHCFENGLALTPENCSEFGTLHPRCGTSFLMFVMIIALVLFSLLGWPGLAARVISRLLLIPVIAGVSFELLKWAGRSSGPLVKALSIPGLLLQKLTTAEPDEGMLEVAIAALSAVLAEEKDFGEGICDAEGRILEHRSVAALENTEDQMTDDQNKEGSME